MFAISSGTETLVIYVAAAVIGAVILGFGRAVMKFIQNRQTSLRQGEWDQRTLSEFFFDRDRDPRTGTPAKEGWTTTVNKALAQLAASQERTNAMVNKILYEITPNGGHNLRGGIDRMAEAAATEIERIRRNEDSQ